MKLENETPFNVVYLPGRLEYPAYSLTVIVKGTFDLQADGPATVAEEQWASGPSFFAEDDPDGERGVYYESDLVHFRPRADLLCVGRCYAPGRRAATEVLVEFGVGRHSRKLRVTGDRRWEKRLLGASVSEPEPFRDMDLGYHRCFGGPGFAPNPIGRGYLPKVKLPSEGEVLLPNIEDPSDLVTSPKSRPAPAGLGPLMNTWEPRASALGTYGENWLATRSPWFPENLDWSVFNAAPKRMQIKGYLRGDEALVLRNLHREIAEFRGQLPGTRVRAFVEQSERPDALVEAPRVGFHEIQMNLDTLWVDTEAERLVLVWRGAFPVATEELEDVQDVLVVQETIGEAERSAEEYRHRLVSTGTPVSVDEPPDHEVETEEVIEANEPAGEDDAVSVQGPDTLAEARASLAALADVPSDASPEILAIAAEAREALRETIAFFEAGPVEPPTAPQPWRPAEIQAAVEQGTSLEGEELPGLIGPGLQIPRADLRGARMIGADLSNANLSGANLENADLTGARLAGADLSGVVLRGAVLRGADLSNTRLGGADLRSSSADSVNLRGAQMAASKLDKADLSNANMTDANLASCSMVGARLNGADLSRADLTKAVLDGARLEDVRADDVLLENASMVGTSTVSGSMRRARLSGLSAPGSSWIGVDLAEATLDGADLKGADFSKTSLQSASLDAVDLREAILRRTDLNRASVVSTNLFRSFLAAADLTDADFTNSNLFEADLSDAILRGATFRDALVGRTRLASLKKRGK